ncbi:MAG: PKD domain-containing protein [Dehalococcoidia bacterium]|nr:PKD domain-containing protein [Dehalococcoidia bacterium]
MRNNRIIYALALMAIITLTAVAACAQPAATPAQETPAGNMPPVIASLTAAQNQTYPGGTVNVQSVVSDPNGDMINFNWTATGGDFVENGRANTAWRAPKGYGTYEIKLTVDDGKGGSAQATVPITVSANNAPSITSLTADPAALLPAATTTLTCIASDQDGDAVQYNWEAREGTLSGIGNKVSWTAPNKSGNYSVTVVVSDGKGAETRQEIVIAVAAPSGVQTFQMVPKESGTITSDGDRDNSIFKAGDDEKNIGYRAFFSYNIFPLMGKDIKQARLKFIDGRVVGDDPFDPVTGVGGFQVMHISYGDTLPKFGTPDGSPFQRSEAYLNKPIVEVDVTPELITAVDNRLERFQAEAGFMKRSFNGNGIAQYVQWKDVVLEVTASDK